MKIKIISRWTDPAKGGTFTTSPSLKATVSKRGGALAAILTCSMLAADFNNHNCFAQSGVKYATGGNVLATTDIFGSTNNASVNFVSNGKKWMTLSLS